jgi:phosphoribosyl-AMP cyclohydrolase
MVGWMDDLALHKTLTTGRSTFFSRSRGEYWVKGRRVVTASGYAKFRLDCDGDAVARQGASRGPACHTGDDTCFDGRPLPAVIAQRAEDADL